MNTSKLLLVVEDEPLIRDLLDVVLPEAGFDLVMATNGQQALDLLDEQGSQFRALVTDVDLGNGPSGWDVARRAREVDATLAVVYMSGGSGQDWASKGVPNSILVAKPFAGAQIVTAVATLLNAVSSSPAGGG